MKKTIWDDWDPETKTFWNRVIRNIEKEKQRAIAQARLIKLKPRP